GRRPGSGSRRPFVPSGHPLGPAPAPDPGPGVARGPGGAESAGRDRRRRVGVPPRHGRDTTDTGTARRRVGGRADPPRVAAAGGTGPGDRPVGAAVPQGGAVDRHRRVEPDGGGGHRRGRHGAGPSAPLRSPHRHDPAATGADLAGLGRPAGRTGARASADQRAGRAGRLGPGVAYRLWSKMEHAARRPGIDPEITQVDLAALVLELAAWGVSDPAALRWLDPPPPAAWEEGVALLRRLGAVDSRGRITPAGKRMADLPLHPRLARMVVDAGEDEALAVWLATILA